MFPCSYSYIYVVFLFYVLYYYSNWIRNLATFASRLCVPMAKPFSPWPPDQGLCSCRTPLGALPPDPRVHPTFLHLVTPLILAQQYKYEDLLTCILTYLQVHIDNWKLCCLSPSGLSIGVCRAVEGERGNDSVLSFLQTCPAYVAVSIKVCISQFCLERPYQNDLF